jgi:hypothetical protein
MPFGLTGVLIEGEKSGLIYAAEREMIEDVLDLADRPVSADHDSATGRRLDKHRWP